MARRRKLKTFRASKEVKLRARTQIGSPPAVRRHESPKRKPPKHKKLTLRQEVE